MRITQFSALTHTSVYALRRYEVLGLLEIAQQLPL